MNAIALMLSLVGWALAAPLDLSSACLVSNGISNASVAGCIGAAIPSGLGRIADTYGTSFCDNPDYYEWPDTLAAYYSFVINNRCATGKAIAHALVIGRMYTDGTTNRSLSLVTLGENDLFNAWPANDYLRVYHNAMAKKGIDSASISYRASVTDSGTWSLNTLYNTEYLVSSTAGQKITFTFTGTAVTIGYLISTTGGNFSVTVDGVSQGTLSCLMSVASVNNVTLAPAATTLYGFTNTTHTVVLTNSGSGNRYISWFYGNGGRGSNGPMIVSTGTSTTTDSGFTDAAAATAYTRGQDSIATLLRTKMGLNTYHASVHLDGQTMFYNTNHYNALGAWAFTEAVWAVFQNSTVQQALNFLYNVQ